MRNRASLAARAGLAFIAVTIVLGYAYGRTRDLIDGPSVSIASPADGSTLTSPLAIIQGKAERVAQISLNGRNIFISKDGQLAEAVVLAAGYNALQFQASDRFGRKKTVELALVYKDPKAPPEASGQATTTTPSQNASAGNASSTVSTSTAYTVASSSNKH